ncbi:thiamine biosynthesis lipoprotein [Sulfurivirga caldicuralii]|uniref:FAD:protein FMN transferase n=1 Tax=Sulfurivirga caldicuralii TaxID=364032 RepID=A0A1N6GNK7_9GAMM|nr:FAD:protein FMN transferase [Sulfurivirga caldicuralii]SIO09078.1 thiamine biosynthesis lipoprotein [Sulfurivirga caldicuralii]
MRPIILFLLVFLTACSQAPAPHSRTFYVFGTQVNVTLYADDPRQAEQAFAALNQRFQHFHHDWHAWEPGGIVARINASIASGQPIEVPTSVKAFILKSQQLCRASGGLFDPGIGALIDLWGFHGEDWHGPPPPQHEIDRWRKQRPSICDLAFQGGRLISRNPTVRLDFGGNAKGLALDMALETLQQFGIRHAIVNIGGDMKALGSKSDGTPWHIGVEDPFQPRQILARIDLRDGEAVVTSGTYERYFDWQGTRYSHILDPTTGWPAHGLVSVTVIHPDATTADAAATALLVAGPKRWRAAAKRMGVTTAAVIDQHGMIQMTPAMQARWHPMPP